MVSERRDSHAAAVTVAGKLSQSTAHPVMSIVKSPIPQRKLNNLIATTSPAAEEGVRSSHRLKQMEQFSDSAIAVADAQRKAIQEAYPSFPVIQSPASTTVPQRKEGVLSQKQMEQSSDSATAVVSFDPKFRRETEKNIAGIGAEETALLETELKDAVSLSRRRLRANAAAGEETAPGVEPQKMWRKITARNLLKVLNMKRSLSPLHEVGLSYFRDLVYQESRGKARDAVIALIDQERESEQIDRALLKNVLDFFVEIGMGQMECYENDFEDALLKDTAAYYSRKASNWIVEDSCPDYMLKDEECLKKEKDRVAHYLHSSSETRLLEKVQNELLVVYTNQLLEKEHSGCRALLRDDKMEDLSRMYRLFLKITKGLDLVANMFKQHVTAEGMALVQNRARYKQEECLKILLRHGSGCYRFADGSYYFGTWSDGLKDGRGTIYPVGCALDKCKIDGHKEVRRMLSHDSSLSKEDAVKPKVKPSISEKIADRFARDSGRISRRAVLVAGDAALHCSSIEVLPEDASCMLSHTTCDVEWLIQAAASLRHSMWRTSALMELSS